MLIAYKSEILTKFENFPFVNKFGLHCLVLLLSKKKKKKKIIIVDNQNVKSWSTTNEFLEQIFKNMRMKTNYFHEQWRPNLFLTKLSEWWVPRLSKAIPWPARHGPVSHHHGFCGGCPPRDGRVFCDGLLLLQ